MKNEISPMPELRSKPTAGKTMVGLLKEFGTKLFHANTLLINELKPFHEALNRTDWINEVILYRFAPINRGVLSQSALEIISSSLISNWLCGAFLGELSKESSLAQAEMWFHNKPLSNCISRHVSEVTQKKVHKIISSIYTSTSIDTLPYLFEVFETGNETANEIGANRKMKKKNGVYYTPADVIDFITDRSLCKSSQSNKELEELTWFDPAVGTGGFLISILNKFSSKNRSCSLAKFSTNNLYGTDISPFALQSASYLLATHCLSQEIYKNRLKVVAKQVGTNLFLTDATSLTDKRILQEIFPSINNGFDLIVSNPPYSKRIQNQLSLFEGEAALRSDSSELFPDFVKILLDLTNVSTGGGGGMVVPLSLVTNSKEKFKELRRYIHSKIGIVEYWNFDRTPDSLFGDDVKTRNTIIFFNHNATRKEKVSSTDLNRWNSRNRHNLFGSISIAELDLNTDFSKGIPKVGDSFGVKILHQIKQMQTGSFNELLKASKVNPVISTKCTAYNWLPIELQPKLDGCTGKVFWTINSHEISAPIAYAILNSRLCYWLWRVWSDGFHLTNQFINDLPFGISFFRTIDKQKLEALGQNLWRNVQLDRITSKNAGVISYSYCPFNSEQIIDEIDTIVINSFNLPISSIIYLKTSISKLVIAGRELELKTSTENKYLELA